jgi:hypothetical protein
MTPLKMEASVWRGKGKGKGKRKGKEKGRKEEMEEAGKWKKMIKK